MATKAGSKPVAKTGVAKKSPGSPGKAVAPVPKPKPKVPATVGGYDLDDLGAGFNDLSREDYAIPFMLVLQSNSPQVDEENPAYVEDAKAGRILNSVTKDLFEAITVIPVHRVHQFLEWIPRDSGGGLVGIHVPEAAIVTKARAKQAVGKIPMDNGHELSECFSVFCLLVLADGNYQQAIINFQSTQIKPYRQWMTRAATITMRTEDNRTVQPPLFAHRYRLSTLKQSNAKGSWFGWNVNFDGDTAEEARLAPTDDLYIAARQFRAMVQTEGQRLVAERQADVAAAAATGGGDDESM